MSPQDKIIPSFRIHSGFLVLFYFLIFLASPGSGQDMVIPPFSLLQEMLFLHAQLSFDRPMWGLDYRTPNT